MKIIEQTFYFRNVEPGKLFMWEDDLYLKTLPLEIDEKQSRNAVCLETNYITSFEDDEPVTPKNGELIIY